MPGDKKIGKIYFSCESEYEKKIQLCHNDLAKNLCVARIYLSSILNVLCSHFPILRILKILVV